MPDPSTWELLDNGCNTSSGWDVTEVNAGKFSVYPVPGVFRLYSPGFGEVGASYTDVSFPVDKFTMEFRAGFKELNSRKYSVNGQVGAGYYSFGIMFSEDGISIQNSAGYSEVANSTKYFNTDTIDTWRVINYPNAGKCSLYRNGYPVIEEAVSDIVAVNTGVFLSVGTAEYLKPADMYFSDVRISRGAYIPEKIYDEKRSTVGVGTSMWEGMEFFHETDTDGDLEKYVKFLGGRFDTEKHLISKFIDDCVDVDTCASKFLPFLGAKVGYEYNQLLDIRTNRAEIKKQIPKKKFDHTIAGIKREIEYLFAKNLIENGSFEKPSALFTFDTWGEDLFNAEISSTTGALNGSTALQCQLAAGTGYGQYGEITSSYFSVDPFSHYNVSMYCMVASTIGAGQVDVELDFYDDNYSLLNFSNVPALQFNDFDTNYTRYSGNIGNYSVPDTAVYGKLSIRFLPGENVTTYFIDDVKLKRRPDFGYKLYETEPVAARFHGTETDNSLLTNYDGHSELFSSSDFALRNYNFEKFHFKPGEGVVHDFDYIGWHMENATSTYVPDSGPNSLDFDIAGNGNCNTSVRGINGHESLLFTGDNFFGRVDISSVLDPRVRSCVWQCSFASNTKGKRQQLWDHTNAFERFEVQLTEDGYLEALLSSGLNQVAIVTGSTDLCDNNFHTVDVVIGRFINELKIYEDNSFAASTSLSIITDVNINQYAFVGCDYGSHTKTFFGHINEIGFKKAGAGASLTYFETEITPDDWVVDVDNEIYNAQQSRYQYNKEVTYNFEKSLQVVSSSSSSLLHQENSDAAKSAFYSMSVDYFREAGEVRCLLTDLSGGVTYFDSTDTSGTGWNNFYHEFQLTDTGFVFDIYGEGTAYFDNVTVVKVDPRRRWGNCKYLGTKYAPCTVVIEAEEMPKNVVNRLALHKVGGSQMLIEINSQDDTSFQLPSYVGYSNTSPYAFASIDFVGTTALYGN